MTRFITALAALLAASSAAAQGTTVTANQGAPSSAVYRGWKTQGNDQPGQAPSGMPVLSAGSDGSAVRTIKTDTAGNQTVVGPTGSGLAPTTNPVLIGGSDSSVITTFRTDTSGRPIVVGAAAAGVTVAGNPVLMGGSDSANAQALRVDTNGRLQVVPTTSAGTESGTAASPLVVTNRAGYVKTGAPTATVSISTVSAAATGLTASSCYRVACNTPAFYRSGAGTPTALTSDNPFYGPAVEKICIPSTDTALAFVTASGTGSCGLALLSNTP